MSGSSPTRCAAPPSAGSSSTATTDAKAIYEAVPTWGPRPDVPQPLAALAQRYPLVILSNAADDQIMHNVDQLGAPFHAVYTAEQAKAYKPRLRAFEYMLEQLGCGRRTSCTSPPACGTT